jgi:hypothetical protein
MTSTIPKADKYLWLKERKRLMILVTLGFSLIHQLLYLIYTADWLTALIGAVAIPLLYYLGWIIPGFVLGIQLINPFCTSRIFEFFVAFFLYAFLFSLVGTWFYYDILDPLQNGGGEFPFSISPINLGAVYGVYFMYRKT